MKYDNIIESDKEVCVVCREPKKGKFWLLFVADKYIAICGECQNKSNENEWFDHLLGEGLRQP